MRFAERLKSAREAAGLSQFKLGAASGCSEQFVSKVEAGERFPGSAELVMKLAAACGQPEHTFLEDWLFDKETHWFSKSPRRLSEKQMQRIREIALDEEREPVAA